MKGSRDSLWSGMVVAMCTEGILDDYDGQGKAVEVGEEEKESETNSTISELESGGRGRLLEGIAAVEGSP